MSTSKDTKWKEIRDQRLMSSVSVHTVSCPHCLFFSTLGCEDFAPSPTSPALPESLPPPTNTHKKESHACHFVSIRMSNVS